jgi:Flp pilus assembly protein CpaB
MTYRLRNIVIAVALASLAAVLTLFYVANYKRHVQQDEKHAPVLVAVRDIPVGTTGSEVANRKFVAVHDVARRNIVPGAFFETKQVGKLVATERIYAGEQITSQRFRPVEERGIRAKLKGNVRALQVPGDPNQLLTGTLNSGDHVDVVATWKFPEASQNHVSRVILRDLLVLRGPQAVGASSKLTSRPNESNSVLLAVTDSQAQKLFWAMRNGEWSLQLRAPRKSADSPENVETAASLLADGVNRGRLRRQLSPLGRR